MYEKIKCCKCGEMKASNQYSSPTGQVCVMCLGLATQAGYIPPPEEIERQKIILKRKHLAGRRREKTPRDYHCR